MKSRSGHLPTSLPATNCIIAGFWKRNTLPRTGDRGQMIARTGEDRTRRLSRSARLNGLAGGGQPLAAGPTARLRVRCERGLRAAEIGGRRYSLWLGLRYPES